MLLLGKIQYRPNLAFYVKSDDVTMESVLSQKNPLLQLCQYLPSCSKNCYKKMHLYSSFPTDILRHHSFFLRGLLKPFSDCRPQDVQFDDLSALSTVPPTVGPNLKVKAQLRRLGFQVTYNWMCSKNIEIKYSTDGPLR